MKFRITTFFLLTAVTAMSFFLPSCRQKTATDHLQPKLMQQILLDVNLAEAYSAVVKDSLHKGGSKNSDSLSVYYKEVFAHYNITQQQFSSSLAWYKNHPEDLDTVYNNIIPVIARYQAQPAKK